MVERYDKERQEADFFEEVPRDLRDTPGYERARRTPPSANTGVSPKLVMAGSVGAVILIALLAFFFSGRPEVSKNDLTILKSGLDRIETRLGQLEGLEKRMNTLEKGVISLRASVRSAVARIDRKRKTPAATPAKTEYYTVRSGDSLYSIAKKHDLTVDRLTQINKLNPKKPIQPGQRLVVTP